MNFVYYNEDNDLEPLSVQIDPVSGFTNLVVNAVHVKREGIELQLNASIIKGKDLHGMQRTFGYLIKNPIKNLYQDQQSVLLSGGAFGTRFARAFQELGSDWGQLIGGGIKRNSEGLMVVDPNTGYYIRDLDKHWGSVVPKATGGFINTLAYKNFVLNFSLDYQIGGKFFSLSESWGDYSGLLDETAATNDKGNNVRDAVANGGGVHVVGVSSVDLKTPVDKYVTGINYFHQFYTVKLQNHLYMILLCKDQEASWLIVYQLTRSVI